VGRATEHLSARIDRTRRCTPESIFEANNREATAFGRRRPQPPGRTNEPNGVETALESVDLQTRPEMKNKPNRLFLR
jgi:hypothetical protein